LSSQAEGRTAARQQSGLNGDEAADYSTVAPPSFRNAWMAAESRSLRHHFRVACALGGGLL